MTDPTQTLLHRRRLLKGLAAALPLALATPRLAYAITEGNTEAISVPDLGPRELSFFHTHTDERLSVVYFDGQDYVPEALDQLNHLMRDFRTGESREIDPGVFDLLNSLCGLCGNGTFDIVSAYRSPHTNAMLRKTRGRGVAKHSLHMEGKAVDIRLNGRATPQLQRAAIALGRGGVGYYPESNFIHIDTGTPRTWGAKAKRAKA